MYIISNTPGAHNSMRITCAQGIIKQITVNAGYNDTMYYQTVLGNDNL